MHEPASFEKAEKAVAALKKRFARRLVVRNRLRFDMLVPVSDFSWDETTGGKHDRYVRVRVTEWTYNIFSSSETGLLFKGVVDKTNCKGLNGLLTSGQIMNDEKVESQPRSLGQFGIADEFEIPASTHFDTPWAYVILYIGRELQSEVLRAFTVGFTTSNPNESFIYVELMLDHRRGGEPDFWCREWFKGKVNIADYEIRLFVSRKSSDTQGKPKLDSQ
jgi:hypothetical protein